MLRPVLLLIMLAVLPGAPWVAAARAAAPAASAAPAVPPALSRADAQQVLDVLNDPVKRAALTATLDRIAHAVAATQPKPPPAPAGLAPNSLGAELFLRLNRLGADFAAQGRDFGKALQSFRYIGPWLRNLVEDPGQRSILSGALLRLGVVLGVAFAVAYGLSRAVRRPIDLLARAAGARPQPPPPAPPPLPEPGPEPAPELDAAPAASSAPMAPAVAPPAMAAADCDTAVAVAAATPPPGVAAQAEERRVRSSHNRAFVRLLYGLRRVPFALLHFVLELIPIAGFALAALAFEFAGLVRLDAGYVVVHSAVTAFAVGGVLFAVVATAFAPGRPALRPVLIADSPAEIATFWLRLMVMLGAWGFAALNVAQSLGMPLYGAAAVSKLLVLVEHTLLAVLIWRVRHDVARHLQPPRRARGELRRLLAGIARAWWVGAIFLDYALWFVWAAQLKDGYVRLCTLLIETAAVAIAARLLSVALLGGLERMLRAMPASADTPPWYMRRAERYYPSARRLVVGAVLVAASIALLQVWGLHAFRWFDEGSFGGRVLSAVVGMLAALLVAVLAWELANGAIERHMDRLSHDPAGGAARLARARTLTPILRVVIFSFIAAVLVLTVLSEIGVNIAPLLGGAGIIGVAIGFGSQKLVQDFITGMFLLLENTMQVGDWVTLGGLSGSVEQLSIRTIRLRAGDGSLHVIPFSSVSTVTNNNRGLGNVPVSVDIALDQDTDQVADTLKAIASELRADPAFGRGMLSDLQYWGVDKVTTQAVTLVGQIVCTDTARYGVQREFNRRLKRRFEADGIRLAAPIQIVRIVPPPDAPGADRPDGGRDAAPDDGRDTRPAARWDSGGARTVTPS